MTDPITAALNRLQEYAAAHPEHDTDEIVQLARAAWAEPVASSPSSMELSNLWDACNSPSVFARAVLARWGNHSADASKMVTPAEGEVAELVKYLRGIKSLHCQRAAELLERHAAPVPVSERLPEPNTKVLAHYFNDHGKGRTICAIWVPAGSRECTVDDSFSEPVEGCWPEGWYEIIENLTWEDYGWIAVNEGEVAYWQPLPKWPANTLPLPAPQGGEVEP